MLRALSLRLSVVGLVWLAAGPAAAQFTAEVIAIRGPEVEPGGERQGADLRRGPGTPAAITINAAECESATTVEFQIRNFPATASVIDMWRGSGSLDCSQESERNIDLGNCVYLTSIQNTAMGPVEFELPVTDLLDCGGEPVNGSNFGIWTLATNANEERGPVVGGATFTLQLDQVASGPPLNVSAGTGDTQITVTWNPPSGVTVDNLFEYRIYGDRAASNCTDMGGELQPGDTAPMRSPGATANNNQTATTVSGADIGLQQGEEAPIAMTAVDRARNESVLSDTACVARVATAGFCAAHEVEGGTCPNCAVGGRPERGLGLVAMVGLALVLRRRRRQA